MTAPNADSVLVSVYTDGMGTYQARCLGCPWRGAWRRKNATAIEDAKGHTEHVQIDGSERTT